MAVTGSDITAAPPLAKARTMSRSLTIPPTEVPSADTTTAPIPCSASTSSKWRTFVSGGGGRTLLPGGPLTSCGPLPRSTSVIRIWPPWHRYDPDGLPAGTADYYWRRLPRAGVKIAAMSGDDLPQLDTRHAHPARVYNYWLGGKDNFAADREAAEQPIAASPVIKTYVRANRAFLARLVRYLAGEGGVRQFLDIGT